MRTVKHRSCIHGSVIVDVLERAEPASENSSTHGAIGFPLNFTVHTQATAGDVAGVGVREQLPALRARSRHAAHGHRPPGHSSRCADERRCDTTPSWCVESDITSVSGFAQIRDEPRIIGRHFQRLGQVADGGAEISLGHRGERSRLECECIVRFARERASCEFTRSHGIGSPKRARARFEQARRLQL